MLQNKTIKLLGGKNYRCWTTPFYSKLSILKLPDLYKLEIVKFVLRFMYNTLYQFFCDIFVKISEVTTRITIPSNFNKLYISRYKVNGIEQNIKMKNFESQTPLNFKTRPSQALKLNLNHI